MKTSATWAPARALDLPRSSLVAGRLRDRASHIWIGGPSSADRKLLTPRQYEHCCMSLNECGRMVEAGDDEGAQRRCIA